MRMHLSVALGLVLHLRSFGSGIYVEATGYLASGVGLRKLAACEAPIELGIRTLR
jgi:hypothetical protein